MTDDTNHNDPLDELFQKKAEEFTIPFREADWKQLEKQLDLYDMRITYRRRLVAITVAAFLLISFLGYFTYENHTRLNQLADQIEFETVPEPEIVLPEPPTIPDSQETEASSDYTRNETEEVESLDLVFADERAPVDQEAYSDLSTQNLYTDNRKIQPVTISGATLSDISVPAGSFGMNFNGQVTIEHERRDRYPETRELIHTGGETTGMGVEHTRVSRISAGISASPDISSVGRLSGFDDPGYKLGLSGEFSLTKNLSVRAGLVASQVRYRAGGSIYNPPNYRNTGITPDETSAVCLILDIPVGLKYNIKQFENSRIFATASLSSYIMVDEDYRFRFLNNYNGNAVEEQLSVRNGSRHFFNNAGFSVGYELDIHPNWSLRAEPFIQMPIREVGWGEVDLYSVGSYVSVFIKL